MKIRRQLKLDAWGEKVSQMLKLFALLLMLLAGCETRRTYLEALNEYRVLAPQLNYAKSARRRLEADRAREIEFHSMTANSPFAFGKKETPAERAQRFNEARESIIFRYERQRLELDTRIAKLEPTVEALKARLKPEDLDLRPPKSKGE
ncbi:MAG TPA: hypothetical protein VHY91_24085 [Pirellulales bacterium]|jgi:hypothetical protein|nr:hypothetical protein [Pirellulales bacterium]